MATTTLADIHPDIVQTHILPRLDGPSLSATATASSHLNALCSDDHLWAHVNRSTWPSIAHPRLDHILSSFPSGHRSFFRHSFSPFLTDVHRRHPRRRPWSAPKSDCSSCHSPPSSVSYPCEFISAVDIRYKNDVVYSMVNFTQITDDFLSSEFQIELNNDVVDLSKEHGISRSIDLTVDEIAGADRATLSHLKDSLTLNWILIDPTRKRACNLSSIKPFSARQDWVSNETVVRYVTVLPGCDPNEVVKCRIQVVLGVGEKGVGLYVKEVGLKLVDLDSVSLNGVEFLRIAEGVIMEEKRVRRRVVDDEERWRSYREFKEMKREKKEWEERRERKKELVICFNYVAIFVSFFFSVYFLWLLLL